MIAEYALQASHRKNAHLVAIEQGFRSVKEMLMEVAELLVFEEQDKLYVQKKDVVADEADADDASAGEEPSPGEPHPQDP